MISKSPPPVPPVDTAARLTLRLFGRFSAEVNDRPITRFRSDRVRALLAFLALEPNQLHHRLELAGLFWGEFPEDRAMASLRQALSNLRQILAAAGPLLTTTRTKVALNADSDRLWIDVTAFDALWHACKAHDHATIARCPDCMVRLQTAAELYQDDLLNSPLIYDSPEFDQWRLRHQEARRQVIHAVLDLLCDYHLRRGNFEAVQQHAQRHLAIDPWREQAHRRLMIALAHNGQRHQALRQYEKCHKLLSTELGIAPHPETKTLYEQLREDGGDTQGPVRSRGPHRFNGPLLPPLQRRKYTLKFRLLDVDGDGFLKREDFVGCIERLGYFLNLPESSPHYSDLLHDFVRWWDQLLAQFGDTQRGVVALDGWLSFWQAHMVTMAAESSSGRSEALDAIKRTVVLALHVLDRDGDGRLSAQEYAAWGVAWRFAEDAAVVFQRLDTDGDGFLTLADLIERTKEFHLSNDPEAPGNNLIGIHY